MYIIQCSLRILYSWLKSFLCGKRCTGTSNKHMRQGHKIHWLTAITKFLPLRLNSQTLFTMVRSLILARLQPQFIASRMAQSASVRIQAFSTQIKEPITVSHTKAPKETGNFHLIWNTTRYDTRLHKAFSLGLTFTRTREHLTFFFLNSPSWQRANWKRKRCWQVHVGMLMMTTTMEWNRKRCLSKPTIPFNSKAKSGADQGVEGDFPSQHASATGSARDDAPIFRLREK